MKYKIILFLLYYAFLFNFTTFSQDEQYPPTEWNFENLSTTYALTIKVHPISFIISGKREYGAQEEASLLASLKDETQPIVYHYLTGCRLNNNTFEDKIELACTTSTPQGFNHDASISTNYAFGVYGYGTYKMEFWWESNPVWDPPDDTCIFDIDYTYPYQVVDIHFLLRDAVGNDPRGIWFSIYDGEPYYKISSISRHFKIWEHPAPIVRSRNYGPTSGFAYVNSNNNLFPFDSRRDCLAINGYNAQNLVFDDNRSGTLNFNVKITSQVITPVGSNRKDFPTYISVTQGCTLNVNATKSIVLAYDSYSLTNPSAVTNLYNYGTIVLNSNGSNISKIEIQKNNRMMNWEGAVLDIGAGSEVRIKDGGKFCNYGGTVKGQGKIIWERRDIVCPDCCPLWHGVIGDSTQLILEDSSSWELAPNSTVTLDGSSTALILNPDSEIKFGYGSKLILKNGARIFANNCKFTSLDSNGTWDGIYLEDNANDTLINCTFENAYNGINIENGNSPFVPYSTQITGCTFNNTTDTQLVSCIYVNSSDGILINDCIVESEISNGYSAGIIAEYCSTNGVIIIDNEINNSTTGIAVIQSSPYIARNIITGLSGTGSGISLDNSNGTIEYNIINNFQKSFSASYSSPYLLKNTFSDASVDNLDLRSNSMPVMKPVASASSLRWLGGNNTITGSPSHSGITFADCYPLMDSGYNRVIVNGSDYMNGIFSMQYTTVNARINYWYDSPPQSSLFDISSGTVNYADYFDGNTVPSTSGYELNSLGFGLYDTVFTNELGDTPAPEDIFIQAYVNEMQENYEDAIDLYKEVVSSFKSSSYAPVSLSRIFNCLEKNQSSGIEYQPIQSYYNSIKTDTNNLFESRELSEDFVIKSKVKQSLLEDAILDYDNIYQNNTNNSKGQHALINKLCLLNMSGGGDNQSSSNSNTIHKTNLLALLLGKDIRNNHLITSNVTPLSFKLHQNYPNPFNPVTTIKYEIPSDNFVTIKIYDLLGREIFNSGENKKAGSHEVKFDGMNYASGMYFYSIESGNFRDTKKMVLLK